MNQHFITSLLRSLNTEAYAQMDVLRDQLIAILDHSQPEDNLRQFIKEQSFDDLCTIFSVACRKGHLDVVGFDP